MKKLCMLFLLFIFTLCLFAQDYVPWSNIRHSSYTTENTMDFRCESAAALFSELIFSYKSGGTWTEIPMTSLSNLTYDVSVPYTIGQDFHYLLKARRDSLVWLTPAKVTSTAFPPAINSISFIGSDPTGDCNVLGATNLDVTGTYFGYSDTKFYAAIENVSGTFPAMTGLTAFNIYICGLLNPEASLADSTLFAMVYVNVPILYSPGIYKVKLSLTDFQFTRIGNIQSIVSNGKLFMSCNISDLTADPTFGAWPNTTNILGFDAATVQAGLSGASLVPALADWGAYTTMSFEDYVVPAYTNHQPALSNAYMTFNGVMNTLTVTYNDEDADFPLVAQVNLDNNQMYELTTVLPIFTGPVEFTCSVPVSGWINGTISVSDNGTEIVTLPISTVANNDVTSAAPVSLQIYPNPFIVSNNSQLDFSFVTKQSGNCSVTIYNIKGQIVKHLVLTNGKAGINHLNWNGRDESGKQVSSGIYMCRLSNSEGMKTGKFLILP